ncbi:MAG: NHLP bacteriocin export ABC transporter permease/ATPase subunit [Lachnospiraceae bacterium]|nr:NHLP bacteriocin export ABC transporter permease/ATPase subunit [Lachnospiraceae bacterium]
MGWFDEQIRLRVKNDDDILSDAYARMANAVSGNKKIEVLFESDRELATRAVGEILKYYRVHARKIPEGMEDSKDILEYLLRPSGILHRQVRLTEHWYKDASGAMLGTRKDGSVVALIPGKLKGYLIVDPANGSREDVNAKTAKTLSEDALCFYKPFPLKKIRLREVVTYVISLLRPRDYIWMFALTGAVTLVQTMGPAITRKIYDDSFLKAGNRMVLICMVLVLLLSEMSRQMFDLVKSIFGQNIQSQLNLQVESAAMMRILSLPISFFSRFNSGELTSRVSAVTTVCSTISSTFFSVMLTAIFSLVYLFQIFNYAPSLLVPALVLTLLTAGLSLATALLQMGVTQRRMENDSKETGMVLALLNGIPKIKVAGAEKRAFAKWAQIYAPSAQLAYNPPFLIKMSAPLSQMITLIGTVVMYYLALKGGVSAADYVAFNAAYALVSGAFTGLVGVAAAVAGIKPSLNMAMPLFETAPEEQEDKEVLENLGGSIEINRVSFRYTDTMPYVLKNLSLKIKKGEYVAIVGRTGCGKSTLLRLLLGFESPGKGGIYYDGRDIQMLDLKSLRKKIGVVLQAGNLFQGNIYSNISISNPSMTVDEAWKVAEMVGMKEDIERMPMGMNTLIQEGGGGISGGQKQRLMIARAIAGKPSILMFDEATSALDNITQKIVSDSLDTLKCTRIVIAHRLSTIRNCDRILMMDEGRIAEEGTYDELIAKGGLFAKLVERQRVDI